MIRAVQSRLEGLNIYDDLLNGCERLRIRNKASHLVIVRDFSVDLVAVRAHGAAPL